MQLLLKFYHQYSVAFKSYADTIVVSFSLPVLIIFNSLKVVNMEASDYQTKEELYKTLDKNVDGKQFYLCLLCSRTLASKQRILTHLYSAHNRSKLFD